MATKKTAAKKKKGIPVAGVAAGVLAAAAAAGATYYFYGTKGAKRHRAAAAKWTAALRRDVMKEAKKLQAFDEKAMHAVVDRVSRAYKGARAIDPVELQQAAMELKANWDRVRRELAPARRAGKKMAKKASKKVVKAAKKVMKKAAKRSRA